MDEMVNLDYYISVASSALLIFLVTLGLIGFFPRKRDRASNPDNVSPGAAWLLLAIWIGFLGTGLNVFYWRALSDYVFYTYPNYWNAYMEFGHGYGELMWKGTAILSIYLHFVARYKALSIEERKHWSPLAMVFYPNRTSFFVKALTSWKRRKKE